METLGMFTQRQFRFFSNIQKDRIARHVIDRPVIPGAKWPQEFEKPERMVDERLWVVSAMIFQVVVVPGRSLS